ncbi:MAG: amino acid kinase, partial [Candidatus Thiodiazotropha lotti]
MWVVKFGGSLYDADNLKEWLRLFTDHSSLVVVPGGGPFADQVRKAQTQVGFDDSTAHAMALQAMEQYGRMLCGLQSGLSPAADVETIYRTLERGDTPVWMPLT